MRRASLLRCSRPCGAGSALGGRPRRQRLASGFTLLELVIAMACVGLVAGGIALSISTCIKVWNRAGESAELHQEARALLEMISRDLRAVYLGLDRQTGYLIGKGGGEAGGDAAVKVIELATHGSGVERFTLLPDELRAEWDLEGRPPLTDYLAVRYEWSKETSDQVAGLYRMTSPVPFSAAAAEEDEEAAADSALISQELLSTAVSGLRFEYYDGKEEEWLDSWDSTDIALRGHPLWAVWVEMTLKDARGREHVFETTVPITAY